MQWGGDLGYEYEVRSFAGGCEQAVRPSTGLTRRVMSRVQRRGCVKGTVIAGYLISSEKLEFAQQGSLRALVGEPSLPDLVLLGLEV